MSNEEGGLASIKNSKGDIISLSSPTDHFAQDSWLDSKDPEGVRTGCEP